MHTPLAPWLDAVWAVAADAPTEKLQKLNAELVKKSAMLDPDAARETWGVAPEHRAMAGNFGRGKGMEAGSDQGAPPPVRKRPQHDPRAYGRTPSGGRVRR